jgi:hypothetical protein
MAPGHLPESTQNLIPCRYGVVWLGWRRWLWLALATVGVARIALLERPQVREPLFYA